MKPERIWNEGASTFMALDHLSQERALHPTLVEMIEARSGKRLLDYGCGDGRLLRHLSARWAMDAFDPSPQMRALARERVGARLRRLTASTEDLVPEYDVVILGMVILCIPDEGEVVQVLRDCRRLMRPTAELLITTTHPCFRTSRFSNFSTSFGMDQPFEYMNDGTPFEVTLKDPGSEPVTFTDYHWSLGFTLEAIRLAELDAVSLVEIPDDPLSPKRNPLVPPFLILRCRRLP